jgi:hypothetical protein
LSYSFICGLCAQRISLITGGLFTPFFLSLLFILLFQSVIVGHFPHKPQRDNPSFCTDFNTMSFVAEVGREHIDTSRNVSISTESNRRNFLRQILPENKLDTQAPVSPRHSTRLSKKRAGSIDTESANQARLQDLTLNTASTAGPSPISDAAREQVCLCQPDPKIPRPRNGT